MLWICLTRSVTFSFTLSQVKSGTIFDNFLITDDVKEAETIGKETWGVTKVCNCWYLLQVVPVRWRNA